LLSLHSCPTRRSSDLAFLLTGDLVNELRRLGGAEVAARGVVETSGMGASLEVREYEVLAVDGQRPHVGVLLARGDDLWLAGSDTDRKSTRLNSSHASI